MQTMSIFSLNGLHILRNKTRTIISDKRYEIFNNKKDSVVKDRMVIVKDTSDGDEMIIMQGYEPKESKCFWVGYSLKDGDMDCLPESVLPWNRFDRSNTSYILF